MLKRVLFWSLLQNLLIQRRESRQMTATLNIFLKKEADGRSGETGSGRGFSGDILIL